MPPKAAAKAAPKLTKKQLEQQRKEEQRKKEEEEARLKQEEMERLAEQGRHAQIQRRKRAEQERVEIVLQKQKYFQHYTEIKKQQDAAVAKQEQDIRWTHMTEQYHKSYSTDGPRLSTFISVFEQTQYQGPLKTLKSCQQAQIYAKHIGYAMLKSRALGQYQQQRYYHDAITRIRRLQSEKLQHIMIQMANSAEEMQQKNSEISKKQPNKKVQGMKIMQYLQHMNRLAKVGMFLNSSTTKNLNKFKPIEIKQFGLNTQIPSKWMNANTIVKFEWVNYNPYTPQQRQEFMIVGGVYMLEFYQLLLPSKKINNIVLKKFYKGTQVLDKFKMPTNVIKEPFNVMYQIPPHIFLGTFDQTSLRFAQYDVASNKWNLLPNDTVVEYDPADKKTTCRIHKPEPIAYIQNICTDFPYVAWQLRCVEAGRALLDIELKRHLLRGEGELPTRLMIQFQIDGASVRLTHPHYPQLQDLTKGDWSAASILYELSQRGIHLLPVDDDYAQAGVPPKEKQAQQNAIRDIAYGVQAFYFRSQPNDSSQIRVKIRQNLEYERVFLEDQEKDWKNISWLTGTRCEVTNRNISQRHINLQVLLENHQFCEPTCLDRIRYEKNYLFKRNVMEILALTRVLSFTTPTQQQGTLKAVLRQRELVRM